MRIVCIGGGPAGLYFAISMKLRDPAHDVLVVERNRPDDTFGWGVVFSNETLDNLWRNDAQSAAAIADSFQRWDDIDVHFKGHVVRSGGHGFAGIARKRLLNILQERARGLGVRLQFEREVEDLGRPRRRRSDRRGRRQQQPDPEPLCRRLSAERRAAPNKYIWLGTEKPFDAFTFIFEQTEHGWIWAHAYRFDAQTSTFIVECDEATWRALGFDRMSQADGIAACEMLFARHLDGQRLISNAKHLRGSAWLNFPRVACERWYHGNVVLLGDAAHTAHFSVGSGTKLALEDAIGLADALHADHELERALAAYQESRRVEVLKLQSAARNSTEWFEAVPRYAGFEPLQFAYALLTRSQRVSHENLRLRDRTFLEGMEQWFAERASRRPVQVAVPPMFTPFRLRGLELANRIAVSPMAMYSAADGVAGDFHLVHLGTRAQGGAGLVFTEMTCVGAEARITPGCAGMYKAEHVAAWTRIVEFVHRHTEAKICLQLGHAGPKGSTKLGWAGMDEPLDDGNWELIAPSAVPWSPRNQVPRPMTRADMDAVLAAFVRATAMAEECGFDMLELHCAHGYLLSAFITPLMNRRTDEYGGDLENRLRFPLEVFAAMRARWPQHKPMSVRISATDWVDDGITGEDSVAIARAFAGAGADIIDVSAGQTSTRAQPIYGRMFQTPFADRIRNEAGIATIAVGNIFEPDHVNSIIAAGRADLCCLARPHLADPYWALHAAAQLGHDQIAWPVQYLSGRDQFLRNTKRAADLAIAV